VNLVMVMLLGLGQTTSERLRHPIAPSLPLLTKAEEARYEQIIERFIEADTGKTKGPAAIKAMAELNKVGPEAIFVLIEGFNRAADLEASCPAVLLGKRIATILGGSTDMELLAFAKENIGAGVTAKRHLGVIKDLRIGAQLRKTAVQRQLALAAKVPPVTLPSASMPLPQLLKAAETARAPEFKLLAASAQKLPAPQLLKLLAAGVANPDGETRQLAQGLLHKQLERELPERLKSLLRDDSAEIRAGAARAIGARDLRFGDELIAALRDVEPSVQQAARQALVRLARGSDFGPEASADSAAREAAIERWRTWWAGRR
jgi:hypothetical protein